MISAHLSCFLKTLLKAGDSKCVLPQRDQTSGIGLKQLVYKLSLLQEKTDGTEFWADTAQTGVRIWVHNFKTNLRRYRGFHERWLETQDLVEQKAVQVGMNKGLKTVHSSYLLRTLLVSWKVFFPTHLVRYLKNPFSPFFIHMSSLFKSLRVQEQMFLLIFFLLLMAL